MYLLCIETGRGWLFDNGGTFLLRQANFGGFIVDIDSGFWNTQDRTLCLLGLHDEFAATDGELMGG